MMPSEMMTVLGCAGPIKRIPSVALMQLGQQAVL